MAEHTSKIEIWLHEGKDERTVGHAFSLAKAKEIAKEKLKTSKHPEKWVEGIDSHDTQLFKFGPGAP